MSEIERPRMKRSAGICFTGIFAAVCCVATFISVPLPFGYFNLGDIFVLVSGWLLGPVFGTLAAAIGTALADLLLGYAMYMPATFIIKGAMALLAFYTYHALFKKISRKAVRLPISAFISELLMVGGYFVFEAFVLGYGVGAVASIFGNALQGIAGIIGATALFLALNASKLFKRYM